MEQQAERVLPFGTQHDMDQWLQKTGLLSTNGSSCIATAAVRNSGEKAEADI